LIIEILHGVLTYQKNIIRIFIKNLIPPFHPHYDIFCGELNIYSWISTAQKELSYDFEIWDVVLSYQKNMIGTITTILIPPFTPHYDILWGELNISSWISTAQKEVSYNFEILHVVLSYQKNIIGIFFTNLIPPLSHPTMVCFGVNLTYPPESVQLRRRYFDFWFWNLACYHKNKIAVLEKIVTPHLQYNLRLTSHILMNQNFQSSAMVLKIN
jgi:hypothetical protein